MKLDRSVLLAHLADYVKQAPGLVIGRPGVGKTYLLKELASRLRAEETPCVFLPIDRLGGGSPAEVQSELRLASDFVDEFHAMGRRLGRKGVMLFDAFDAARSESSRRNFLALIRRAVMELSPDWNVIVTVRSYDAAKSRELQALFPRSLVGDAQLPESPGIKCRHIEIPKLSDEEFAQAETQIAGLSRVLAAGGPELKEVARVPFNLWLLEKVLGASPSTQVLSGARSETQLLDLFWDQRVRSRSNRDDLEYLLRGALEKMVSSHTLAVPRQEVYSPAARKAWEDLLSAELLVEEGPGTQLISFGHNILFDFAASILLIDEDPESLHRFISVDPSRPLFLRPTLVFFFTRLWYTSRSTFWRVLWTLVPTEVLHVRLVVRIIPATVIADEAIRSDDLSPLLQGLSQQQPTAAELTLRILQALRVAENINPALWAKMLATLSGSLDQRFAWDLTTVASTLLDRSSTEPTSVRESCGVVGRTVLDWVWARRERAPDPWADALGGNWAVPLVAKTFDTAIAASSSLLRRVLTLTREPDFPIGYLWRLSSHVQTIWSADPNLVADVYRTVFTHEETSTAKTSFGTPVLPMTSNRRQDFQMCQWQLAQQFSKFLRAQPELATSAAVDALNEFAISQHVLPNLKEHHRLDDLIKTFVFLGGQARYLQDLSCIWDQGHRIEDVNTLAQDLFGFLSEQAGSDGAESEVRSILEVLRDGALAAVIWRRLLRTGSRTPRVFAPLLFELCVAEPVQVGPDTSYDLGEFLKVAPQYWSRSQRIAIEHSLLNLAVDGDVEDPREQRGSILLSQIPAGDLVTSEARERMAQLGKLGDLPKNQAPYEMSVSARSFTEADWLEEHGVDVRTPTSEALLGLHSTLEGFSSRWMNDTPDEQSVVEFLPQLTSAFSVVNSSDADRKLLDDVWTKLAASACAIARRAKALRETDYRLVRDVLLAAAARQIEGAVPAFESPSWSPTAKHEAAKALPWLAAAHPDDSEVSAAIAALVQDPVAAVRFLVAVDLFRLFPRSRDLFWSLASQLVEAEHNEIVLAALVGSVARVAHAEEKKALELLRAIGEKLWEVKEPGPELVEAVVGMAVSLDLLRGNTWAKAVLRRITEDDSVAIELVKRMTFSVAVSLTPKALAATPEGSVSERAPAWLQAIIACADRRCRVIRAKAEETAWSEDLGKALLEAYGLVDDIVARLYFSTLGEDEDAAKTEDLAVYYKTIDPVLESVLSFARSPGSVGMFAPTAHHFLQLLSGMLPFMPVRAIHMAAEVATLSEGANYNLDSLAIGEVVRFVETVLADFRYEVRAGEPLNDLLTLLDVFAKAGWPDAIRLVWRLDEVFR